MHQVMHDLGGLVIYFGGLYLIIGLAIVISDWLEHRH